MVQHPKERVRGLGRAHVDQDLEVLGRRGIDHGGLLRAFKNNLDGMLHKDL